MSPAALPTPELAPPGPIEPAETPTLESRDGTSLHAEWFPADHPRGAALILHGYHEHCGRYREVAHVLIAAGISALSFDLRGHGRSAGQRGYVESIRDHLDDLEAGLAALITRADTQGEVPIALVGHSNGGLLALRALADPFRAPARVVAAAVSSPFLGLKLEVPRSQRLIGQVASRLAPRLTLPNKLAVETLTADPAKQEERRLDTLCHDVVSARWFIEAAAAQRYVLDFAARIAVPTLWLVAAGDRIADPAVSRVAQARMHAPSEYHSLDGFEHEVFNERERGRAFALLVGFLTRHFTTEA